MAPAQDRTASVRAALLTALALLALVPAGALAQCPRTSVADIEDEVMCPVCGTTLQLATEAPQAIREREFIQRQVDSCKSKAQVKDALAAEFGPGVLAVPEDSGFALSAYLVPIAVMILGLGGILLAAARWRRRPAAPAGPAPPPLSSSESDRLDRDMERYGR